MSADDTGPIASREVAYRLFAAEYDGADLESSDDADERAPNYVVTPTGARVNRLFVVGVLTAVEPVSDDVLRARVVDPTGAFVVYAGQYQPEAVAFLEGADVPSFVAVTGKARTFKPDGSERIFTSVRPEAVTAVDAATRDRWTVQAAEHTLARIATMARALEREERGDALAHVLEASGVDPGLAAGTALAIDHYGTSRGYLAALRERALAAAEVVAGTRESVPELQLAPDDDGPVEADLTATPAVAGTLTADLAEVEVDVPQEPAEAVAPDDAGQRPTESATESASAPTASDEGSASSTAESSEKAEPSPTATEEPSETADELGDFVPENEPDDVPAEASEELYELDEAEREAVESEYGTEFSSGSEVGEPGEAGIDTETPPPATESEETDVEAPGPSDPAEPAADDEVTADPSSQDPAADDEVEMATDADATESAVDLEDAAVETMGELDEGDGVPYDDVVEAVVAAHDAEPSAVEDAIEDALMGGRCYEPTDGYLKAI